MPKVIKSEILLDIWMGHVGFFKWTYMKTTGQVHNRLTLLGMSVIFNKHNCSA